MKKTKGTEQYSKAKVRMSFKLSPKKNRRKNYQKFDSKSEASKSSVPYVKENQLQRKKEEIEMDNFFLRFKKLSLYLLSLSTEGN